MLRKRKAQLASDRKRLQFMIPKTPERPKELSRERPLRTQGSVSSLSQDFDFQSSFMLTQPKTSSVTPLRRPVTQQSQHNYRYLYSSAPTSQERKPKKEIIGQLQGNLSEFEKTTPCVKRISVKDLDCKVMKLSHVPSTASQTCSGQVLIKPVVERIPFDNTQRKVKKSTIRQFKLSSKDQALYDSRNSHQVDYVQFNIKLAENIKKLKEVQSKFRRSVLAKNNACNLEILLRKQNKTQQLKRESLIDSKKKWERFREDRAKIVDKYLLLKRKQLETRTILTHISLVGVITTLSDNFKYACKFNQAKVKKQFMKLFVAQRWRRRQRRFGSDVNLPNLRIFKREMTFMQVCISRTSEKRAKLVLKAFFQKFIGKHKLIAKAQLLHKKMARLQQRYKKKQMIREARVDMLCTYWEKMLAQIENRANSLKDYDAIELCKKLAAVPEEVKFATLRYYMNRCQEVHQYAFLQWRKNVPFRLKYNMIESDRLLNEILKGIRKDVRLPVQPSDDTIQGAKVDKTFYSRYYLTSMQPPSFFVSSFGSVGQVDPFPQEGTSSKSKAQKWKNINQGAYPAERLDGRVGPSCIFIPTREVLIKLMRACIAVEDPSELWFRQLSD